VYFVRFYYKKVTRARSTEYQIRQFPNGKGKSCPYTRHSGVWVEQGFNSTNYKPRH